MLVDHFLLYFPPPILNSILTWSECFIFHQKVSGFQPWVIEYPASLWLVGEVHGHVNFGTHTLLNWTTGDIQCVNNIVKYLNRHLEYPKVSKLFERIHFLTVMFQGIKAELDAFWADKVEMGEISKPELKKLNAVVFLMIFFKIDIKMSELAC